MTSGTFIEFRRQLELFRTQVYQRSYSRILFLVEILAIQIRSALILLKPVNRETQLEFIKLRHSPTT